MITAAVWSATRTTAVLNKRSGAPAFVNGRHIPIGTGMRCVNSLDDVPLITTPFVYARGACCVDGRWAAGPSCSAAREAAKSYSDCGVPVGVMAPITTTLPAFLNAVVVSAQNKSDTCVHRGSTDSGKTMT